MFTNKVIKIAENTKYFGLKKIFTHKGQYKNKKCGDKISIELIIKDNKFISMRYETESCIYTQASASLIAKKIKIFNKLNFKKDYNLLKNSLSKNVVLNGKYGSFKDIFNKVNYKREDCILLPLTAIIKVLKLK